MRRVLSAISGVALALLVSGDQSRVRIGNAFAAPRLRRLEDAIAAREYEASENGRGLQAPNRAQGLRTYFAASGIRVVDRIAAGAPELAAFSLSGVGRGASLAAPSAGEVSHEGARVEIRRPGLTEWYRNAATGLEQGFTVSERPTGAGPLVLELAIRGAEVTLAGDSLVLRAASGRRLVYGDLHASDSEGRVLPAHLELANTELAHLVIDDGGATYPLAIDPIFASFPSPDTSIHDFENDQFGVSVADAGDTDGDGYADVIIGMPGFDSGSSGSEGAAVIFLGDPNGIANADPLSAWTLIRGGPGELRLGEHVASAGDVNGDGYGDVVVSDQVEAVIFHGGPNGIRDGTPVFANTVLSSFGNVDSVASAGDVNGDGYSDVIVGSFAPGTAWIFLGGPSGIASGDPSSAATTLTITATNPEVTSVASAGDVNGDGYDDVLVGAYFANSAFVFRGSAAGIPSQTSATAATTLTGGANFGYSLATAGDVNGDGYADVIVGSIPGVASIFLGGPSGIPNGTSSTAPGQLFDNDPNNVFGFSVASAGDINGDGFSDVVVGAPFLVGAGTGGGAFVYLGGPGGISSGDQTTAAAKLADSSSVTMGHSVASAGDVNGDGFGDLVVGAPLDALDNGISGYAFIYLGGPTGLRGALAGAPGGKVESNQASAELGASVAGAGDVNGDGYSDLIVGAPFFDSGETDEGAAFIYLGGPSGVSLGNPTNASAILQSNQANAQLGASVASAGDVNGDGYADVIVGAPLYDDPNTDEGAAFVFLGGPSGVASGNPITAYARFESNQDAAQLGASVASAGDVNGDGRSDVIVGAPLYDLDQSNEGAAFVFVSSPTGLPSGSPATAQATLQLDQSNARFGTSLASAGDMNGDGYGEVIVGAPQYGDGIVASGVSMIYRGSPTGTDPNSSTRLRAGGSSGGRAGTSVAGAGDVDGDGFDDVIVSQPGNSSPAVRIYAGRATLPASILPTDATTLLSDANSGATDFGHAVAGAGDLNGDGFADVIVGCDSGSGAVTVYYGRAGGIPSESSASANVEIDGDEASSLFANGVAGVGDVNGDGFADIAVGAPLYDNGQTDEGLAFLFYGGGKTGRPVTARQRRGNGSGVPVHLWGDSVSGNGFVVQITATDPVGRGRVKAEAQACPELVAFDSAGCVSAVSATWTPVTPASLAPVLSLTLSGLPGNKPIHWRARILRADATETPPLVPIHGPWRTYQALASNESLRTSRDADLDGTPDGIDNCPYRANPGQEDAGGFGSGSATDGIGDVCQCGNVTGDGRVASEDVTAYRQALANPSGAPLSPSAQTRCVVYGTGTACNLVQVSVIRRSLHVPALPPVTNSGLAQSCAAAKP